MQQARSLLERRSRCETWGVRVVWERQRSADAASRLQECFLPGQAVDEVSHAIIEELYGQLPRADRLDSADDFTEILRDLFPDTTSSATTYYGLRFNMTGMGDHWCGAPRRCAIRARRAFAEQLAQGAHMARRDRPVIPGRPRDGAHWRLSALRRRHARPPDRHL